MPSGNAVYYSHTLRSLMPNRLCTQQSFGGMYHAKQGHLDVIRVSWMAGRHLGSHGLALVVRVAVMRDTY